MIGKADQLLIVLIVLGLTFILARTLTGPVKGLASGDAAVGQVTEWSATSADATTIQKANETPHFWQRDSRSGFQNGGRDYCCPVAVSNSLVYLARHGFPALLPDGSDDQPQIDLINQLASSSYFGTDPDKGTSPGAVLTGVQKYVEAKGYECERLEYEGWRKVGRNNYAAIKATRPALDWMEEGIRSPNGAVWLNFGWYRQLDQGHWKRTGGHWVTLVGYAGAKSVAAAESSLLLIHNPATRSNANRSDNLSDDIIQLEKVSAGTLYTDAKSTENATGMYQVSGPGLSLPSGIDVAFLDAAIVLVVKP